MRPQLPALETRISALADRFRRHVPFNFDVATAWNHEIDSLSNKGETVMDDTVPIRGLGCRIVAFAVALATAWFTGCSNFGGTTAASFLRSVREDPDPNVRFAAYSKLASPRCYDRPEQKIEAAELMMAKLEQAKEPVASRAVICRTLGELRAGKAREALLKAVGDPEGVIRCEACRALGKVGQPEDATILARVMTVDTLEDCRIAAIDGIGELKARDPRIMQVLVSAMEHDDPAIRLCSLQALRKITGKDYGVDPAPWRKELFPQEAAPATTPDSIAAAAIAGRPDATSPPPTAATAPPSAAAASPR
jgi:hypothetical protein